MACKRCASENLQELEGELSASFPDIKRSNVNPSTCASALWPVWTVVLQSLSFPHPNWSYLRRDWRHPVPRLLGKRASPGEKARAARFSYLLIDEPLKDLEVRLQSQ